ncbi:MAG: ParM/StbA family protein [Clostridiales bacterium]|nr:ParM/StbA family protein [Clostridiales bacterium]
MDHIIGVDTGNRCMKTAHCVFISGLVSSTIEPGINDLSIEYEGVYYSLSNKRVVYQQNKSKKDDYFLLTLFAILKELAYRKVKIDADHIPNIRLGVGLPPKHMRLKQEFHDYFSRGMVEFKYNKNPVKLNIVQVTVFAQGFAAIYAKYPEISQFSKAYIVDIGGYTTDVIEIDDGEVELSQCLTYDNVGVIPMFEKISNLLKEQYGESPDERYLDTVLNKDEEIFLGDDVPVLDVIKNSVAEYTEYLLSVLQSGGVNLRIGRAIFVGGGAVRLRPYLEASSNVRNPYFGADDIHNNARGYEAFMPHI